MATSFSDYRVEKGKSLFEDLIKHESETGTRIVYENENWVIFVPYFARFAYETYLVPKRHFQNISQLNKLEKETLSDALHIILNKYDALFGFPLPNIMLLMNAPMAHSQFYNPQDFHFHIQFLPPLREADKLKYLAGFESGGGNIINPIAPEIAAEILKKL